MADTKKEYTSNLHPKGDLGTTVYPNVKSENIIDKDTTAYTAGKVPDSSLVSKSLDGLNEKIETNKIQTDTNKTNIATLQGDVSSLKSDNQTTKTTVVGLVSSDTTNKANIATNTQNIENLSAVMPTDINVDANGYAILEHDGTEITGQKKKVKFAQIDKSVSFSEVTIPTVSDLKTQDGSTFSGGSKVYNGSEYLPTFDIATLKDTYVDLSTDQTIHGIKTIIPNIESNCGIKITQGNYYGQGEKIAIRGIGNNGSESGYLIFGDKGTYYSVALAGSNFTDTSVGVGNTIRLNSITADLPNAIYMAVRSGAGIQINAGSNRLQFWGQNKNANHPFQLSKDYGSTFSNILTDADLPHHYRHTVKISKPTDDGKTSITFTASSEKNTPIDSIQDLTTVFGNTDLSVSGATFLISSSQWEFYNKIHVGTSITDTTFDYINKDDVGTYNFIDMFGTTGFTITDNVTAM